MVHSCEIELNSSQNVILHEQYSAETLDHRYDDTRSAPLYSNRSVGQHPGPIRSL